MNNSIPESSPPTPRQRPKTLRWLAAATLLFLAWFCWQLFGPNPPIIVSKETTHITAPLHPDGLPDYRRYLLERYREGVTPENNAAVLLLQAIGLGKIAADADLAIRREIDPQSTTPAKVGSTDAKFIPLNHAALYESVHQWIAAQTNDEGVESACDAVLSVPLQQPWKSNEVPPLAAWLDANQPVLDLVVDASRFPRYYSPPLAIAGKFDEPLAGATFPGQFQAREAARALMARAMWNLGEGRADAAWQDVAAIRRLALLLGQGQSLIEQIVSVGVSDLACAGAISILHHGDLSAEQIKNIRHELAATPPFDFATNTINQYERLAFLEIVTQLASRDSARLRSNLDLGSETDIVDHLSIDWNRVLEDGNDYFNRLAAASRSPLHTERFMDLARLDDEIEANANFKDHPSRLLLAIFSRRARSRVASDTALNIFVSVLPVALRIQERANTQLALTRVAAALAEHRAEHGSYPRSLAELGTDEAITDPFSDSPFIYRRDVAGGYLLYSVFHNHVDDGGTDGQEMIVDGEWVNEYHSVDYFNESDYVIRIPRPPFKLPAPNSSP